MISLTDSLADVPREPDAVAWVPGLRQDSIATANEGDLVGGSRGFSIFRRNGSVLFDSGTSFEEIAVRHGHYPEGRSGRQGHRARGDRVRDSSAATTTCSSAPSAAASSPSTSSTGTGRPQFVQLLPAPLGPKACSPIPQRNLLVASGEEDVAAVRCPLDRHDLRARSAARRPIRRSSRTTATARRSRGRALSGLTAVPGDPQTRCSRCGTRTTPRARSSDRRLATRPP